MATNHLTPGERDEIARLLAEKVPKRQIAKRLGRAESTITRELKRNSTRTPYSGRRRYCAIAAQQKCDARRHQRRCKKMQQPEVRDYVQDRLEKFWSPDQIAGRMKLDFAGDPRRCVSRQTIYQRLHEEDCSRRFQKCLRRYRLQKRRKKQAPKIASIANRPEVIERRERVGDWEGDTIVGSHQSGAVVSAVERKTGYTILAKVGDRCSATINQRIIRRLQKLPRSQRRSITFDNGSEFAGHRELTKSLAIDVYFAEPRKPWQRGTNENTNGLVRQFLPKGTSFRDLTAAAVSCIQTLLNERPRRRLGYRTPQELLQEDASRAMLC